MIYTLITVRPSYTSRRSCESTPNSMSLSLSTFTELLSERPVGRWPVGEPRAKGHLARRPAPHSEQLGGMTAFPGPKPTMILWLSSRSLVVGRGASRKHNGAEDAEDIKELVLRLKTSHRPARCSPAGRPIATRHAARGERQRGGRPQ